MDASTLLTLGLCRVAVILASLAGGSLPAFFRLACTRLRLCIRFIAGLMLGMALLQLLPHGIKETKSVDLAAGRALGGFLVMFFLQRVFHYHPHGLPEEAPAACGHSTTFGLVGLGTALAVILHKPFDALAVLSLMPCQRLRPGAGRAVNVAFAFAAPLGASLALAGLGQFTETHRVAGGCALAFCGGDFLCIACSDLLPELHFHSHDRLRLSLALAAGLGVDIGVGWLEPQAPRPRSRPPSRFSFTGLAPAPPQPANPAPRFSPVWEERRRTGLAVNGSRSGADTRRRHRRVTTAWFSPKPKHRKASSPSCSTSFVYSWLPPSRSARPSARRNSSPSTWVRMAWPP